mgnify:CR=1 FL=1
MVPIIVKSFKNDGTIHRSWYNVFLIENNENFFVLGSLKAIVMEDNGRRWVTREPAITIFPKHEWYNVCCMIKKDKIAYYVNLASFPLYESDAIKYVDYDLDIKFDKSHDFKLLDSNEYEANSKSMNYDIKIDGILKAAILQVKDLANKNLFPFNDNEIYKIFYDFKAHYDLESM